MNFKIRALMVKFTGCIQKTTGKKTIDQFKRSVPVKQTLFAQVTLNFMRRLSFSRYQHTLTAFCRAASCSNPTRYVPKCCGGSPVYKARSSLKSIDISLETSVNRDLSNYVDVDDSLFETPFFFHFLLLLHEGRVNARN